MANGDSGPGRFLHRPLYPDGRTIPAVEDGVPCEEPARPFVLAATILASAMAFIDRTVVTIALPALQSDFGASFSSLQWVVNAYALFMGGLILIGGAAGDRFGRKRMFILGIVVFALASFTCAQAPSIDALIAARAAQGMGAALLVPQSLAIIAASFPRDMRGRAIGIWAGAAAITTAMGPPLGGFLIDVLDWRAVFWINLPLSVVAVWLTLRYVPESRDSSASGPLDWRGGILASLALGALTVALTLLPDSQGLTAPIAILLVGGLIGVALFVRTEARALNPLMPLVLFRSRAFSAANVMTLFLYGAFGGILFLLPFDLIERRGMSAAEVGATLLPLGLVIGVVSRFAGRVADRHGPRILLVLGSLLVTAAALGLAARLDGFLLGVLAPVLLLALGMALVVAPLTTAVMNTAPASRVGAASGVSNAASRLAGLFAVAVLGSVASLVFFADVNAAGLEAGGLRFGVLPGVTDANRAVLESAFLSAYSLALTVAAVWSALAALTAFVFLRSVATK